MTVIDIHTHMLTTDYLDLLRRAGSGHYQVAATKAGQDAIFMDGVPFMTLFPQMWDYDLRIEAMDRAGVDLAIVSLTTPNVYWGDREISLHAARMVNDSMAQQQRARPDRIRWFASLPWQHAEDAVMELGRAVMDGAVGVMVLANIAGDDLTDPKFSAVWQEIDRMGLPVLVHPTAPLGLRDQRMDEFGLVPPIGFMFDTTLAFARMIFSGFIDRYPKLKLIAAHGGGALPYLAGRLDRCHEMIPACAEGIQDKPSTYLQRIYYDTVVYDPRALELCIAVAGTPERVLYGSDYPHNIGDIEGCLARVRALSPGAARQIGSANAEHMFSL
jgi:aminocarboxymuconate-semialdehyde decarboxylase